MIRPYGRLKSLGDTRRMSASWQGPANRLEPMTAQVSQDVDDLADPDLAASDAPDPASGAGLAWPGRGAEPRRCLACAARPAADVLLPGAWHHDAAARAGPGHGGVHGVRRRPDRGTVALLRLQEATARRRHRIAADVGGGPLTAPAVPGLRLSAARGGHRRARPDPDPRRRRLAEWRGPVDRHRRAAHPALRDRQAGPGGVGRRPARAQGPAGPAGRLAAHARAAHAGYRGAVPARDDRG